MIVFRSGQRGSETTRPITAVAPRASFVKDARARLSIVFAGVLAEIGFSLRGCPRRCNQTLVLDPSSPKAQSTKAPRLRPPPFANIAAPDMRELMRRIDLRRRRRSRQQRLPPSRTKFRSSYPRGSSFIRLGRYSRPNTSRRLGRNPFARSAKRVLSFLRHIPSPHGRISFGWSETKRYPRAFPNRARLRKQASASAGGI